MRGIDGHPASHPAGPPPDGWFPDYRDCAYPRGANLALAPVNLLVLVAADASAVRTLAGVALASAAAQAAAQRRAKRAGMKAL